MAIITINDEKYSITCTSAKCKDDLHCFKTSKTLQKQGIERGCCRYCKVSLVNWDRIYRRDINDFNYLKKAFKFEMIRNFFWSVLTPLPSMINEVNKMSPKELSERVMKRLKTTLAKKHNENFYDGRQTPVNSKNIIHWAQHATGTCCRTCLDEWHGINENDNLSENDYIYLQQIVLKYIYEKVQVS
jgi:hypothetical protein